MRLHELHIEGFGHFRDHVVEALDRKVTVLHGPNEAGKSTLLAFIRTMLFGFPARGRDGHYPPLAGGRHGGRITLVSDSGESYTLERFAGPRGGTHTLRAESGQVNVDPAALQRLTGHATLDLFSNVFAFSLDEIQSEGLMSNSEVAGRLYSVGMGASGLPEFSRDLSGRRDALFRPRGSAQRIAGLLRDLHDIDGQLQLILGNAEEYRRLTTRQDVILRELEEADGEISRLNLRLSEIHRLLEGWDDWVALEGLESRLRAMSEFEGFPESAIERLEELEDRVRRATEERDEEAGELRQLSEAAEANVPGEDLLDDAERIEAIRRARSSFDGSVHDLPERQDEMRKIEDALSDRLHELGDGWDEASLDDIDTSLSNRQQVEIWRERLNEAAGNTDAAAVRLEQGRGLLEKLRAEEQQAQGRLRVDSDGLSSGGPRPESGRLEDLLDDREEVERVRRGRGSFDDSVRDLPERRAELKAQEDDITRKLLDLGPGWDESRLDGFDTSIVFRQEVDGFRQRLSERSDRVRSSRERYQRERADLVERRAAVDQARVPAERPTLEGQEIDLRRNALRTARSRLNDHERASINLDNLRAQLASLTGSGESAGPKSDRLAILLPVLLGVAGVLLILAGSLLGQESLLIGVVAGVVLLGVAAYQLMRGRDARGTDSNPLVGPVAERVRDSEASVARATELLEEAVQQLGMEGAPTADALDNAEAELDAASGALTTWDEARHRVEEARLALEAQERRVEEARAQEQAAVEAEASSWEEWQQWLGQRRLDEGLTPETLVEFTGRIETARVVLQSVRQMRQRVSAIGVDIDEYHQLVQPLADRYGIPLDDASHQRVMAVADTLIESLDSVRQLVTQRDDARARLGQQERAESDAVDDHRTASQELDDRQTGWRGWLQERGLDESFAPGAVLEFLARAETAHAHRTETRRMRDRVSAIEVDIDQFRDQVRPLALSHGVTLDTADPLQLATAADTLISRLEEAQRQVSERDQSRQRETQQRQRLEQMEQRLQSAKAELTALLATGGAGDAEEFRHRVGLYAQRQDLETQRDERLRSLSALSGPGKRLAAFRDLLADSDPDDLRNESRMLSERVDILDAGRNELREERGENNGEIARLAGEEESSDLRIQRSVFMEQLQEDAREWSRLTIAGVILDRTQRKFEQERQPNVIRHAEEFFSKVTGHRYTRLYAPVGERTITVTHASGRDRRPEELSRGTREQLYLALRFGLIREFGEHAERLPVVVDEALVNFDPERASLAASAFFRLSETNQVLVFTCHRTIADTFADLGAQVVDIGLSSS